jgi:rod shape-determining protein MreD
MRYLILALAVYAAAVVQTSLAPALEVRHVMPDLFALAAVLWELTAVRRDADRAADASPRGFFAAALVGLAYDLTSSGPLGVGFGLFTGVGWLIASIRAKFDLAHLLMQLSAVFFATAAIAGGEAVIWRLRGETALPWTTLVVRAACVGVYTTAVAVPIVMVLGWLREVRRPQNVGRLS